VVLDTVRWLLRGTVDESAHEVRFTVRSALEAENGGDRAEPEALVGATITLCTASADGALLLTDVPQRLGLKGGTYVLASIRSRF
jgi:hypothetical protein